MTTETTNYAELAARAMQSGDHVRAKVWASIANAAALERLADGMHRMADTEEQSRAAHEAQMAKLEVERKAADAEHRERMARFEAGGVDVLAANPGTPTTTWDAPRDPTDDDYTG